MKLRAAERTTRDEFLKNLFSIRSVRAGARAERPVTGVTACGTECLEIGGGRVPVPVIVAGRTARVLHSVIGGVNFRMMSFTYVLNVGVVSIFPVGVVGNDLHSSVR